MIFTIPDCVLRIIIPAALNNKQTVLLSAGWREFVRELFDPIICTPPNHKVAFLLSLLLFYTFVYLNGVGLNPCLIL